MSAPRRIDTTEEFLAVSAGHPVARLDVGAGFHPPAYAAHSPSGVALAFQRRSDTGRPGLAFLLTGPTRASGSVGEGRYVDEGLRALAGSREVGRLITDGGLTHVSTERPLFETVEALFDLDPERGGDWDWLWTEALPPRTTGEERVIALTEDTAEEVSDFLARANPRTHGRPFSIDGARWVGVRDADTGELLACGSSEPTLAGFAFLAGIATEPTRRREGLGAAVTAYLTREAVTRTGACTLGMYADNDGARRLYEGLGYATGARWRSRWLRQA